MGMRLIDAYALQDEIHKSKMENPHKDAKVAKNHDFEHDHFMWMVTMQPTAQEAVVRCKDCVFRDDRDGLCEHVQQVRDPDWFCADGERRLRENERNHN